LWCSLGHYDANGRFRINGVTGPDKYCAIADNNVCTNLMAQQNLNAAADAVARHPEQADLVLAMHLRSDAFTEEPEARDFGYYERLTVRDSSRVDEQAAGAVQRRDQHLAVASGPTEVHGNPPGNEPDSAALWSSGRCQPYGAIRWSTDSGPHDPGS
jgi:trehalose/maltose hydrolase-like predicted phosphorylase